MTVEPTLEEEVPTPADAELDDLIDKVMDIIDEKIKISQAKALLKVANYDINKIEYAYELACKQGKYQKSDRLADCCDSEWI